MAFFIFMIMQFIRGIPRELDEAAEIDGCSHFGIFFRIILPLIRPAADHRGDLLVLLDVGRLPHPARST